MTVQSLPPAPGQKRRAGWRIVLVAGALAGVSSSGAAPKAAQHTVVIEATQFSPATLEVKVGDSVTWKNLDPFPHTVTSDRRLFDSGDIKSGRSWKLKAKTKGVFPYICTLHPNMTAVLVVK